MANICTTNYVIEGEKKELDTLYQTMKEQQENNLGCLVKVLGKNPEEVECRGVWTDLERQGDNLRVTFETAWTPCYEVTTLLKEIYSSLRIFYKAEEPGCEVYLKNVSAKGKGKGKGRGSGRDRTGQSGSSGKTQGRSGSP